MAGKVFCTVGIAVCIALLIQSGESRTRRSNGMIKRCGNDQREFLRWFCREPTFEYPFPFHRVYLVLRYRAPYKRLYPFQHQASMCCRHGCHESGYQRMCRYHKWYKKCTKQKNYRHTSGRKPRLLSVCSGLTRRRLRNG